MLSFLEYLVFFGAVFCTEQLKMICRMDFDMFFGILTVLALLDVVRWEFKVCIYLGMRDP